MTSCVDRLAPAERILCNSNHCDGFQQTSGFHAICNCTDWEGKPIPNCNPKDNLYPVQTGQCLDRSGNYLPLSNDDCYAQGFQWKICYCCCSCFSAKTPVAIPSGMRAIGDINIGDPVLAAAKNNNGWSWSEQIVHFSSGSPPSATGTGNLMFLITYDDGKSVVASPNQLFLLSGSGKLKRADQLVPGVDQLVNESGSDVAIHRVDSGNFTGAVHHIATDVPSYEDFTGSLDNHLINVNGIISGDYLLQLFQDTDKMKPNLVPATDPVVGTPAYKALYPAAHASVFSARSASAITATAAASSLNFAAHAESATTVPNDAAMLFTPQQEAQLLDPDIPKRALSDSTNKDMTAYYSQLFSSFYPDVRCYLDWTSTRANIFAFTNFGQKTVVIGGELLRLGSLYDAAICTAISFGVANLVANPDGDLTRGRALYVGMGELSRNVLKGGSAWADTTLKANEQLGEVFRALIAKGDAGDESASLTCLLSVMNAAVSGDELPPCAGGPVMGSLKVASASYDEDCQHLTLTFSAPLSAFSATNLKNYRITPATHATAAVLAPGNPAQVVLSVDLAAGTYDIAVVNVRAADGASLDPSASKTSLTVA